MSYYCPGGAHSESYLSVLPGSPTRWRTDKKAQYGNEPQKQLASVWWCMYLCQPVILPKITTKSKVLRLVTSASLRKSIPKQSLDSFLCTLNLAKWLSWSCHAYHDSVGSHPFWGPRRLTLSRKHEPWSWNLGRNCRGAVFQWPRSYAVASIFCCLVLGAVCIIFFKASNPVMELQCSLQLEPCYLCRVVDQLFLVPFSN